MLCTSWKGGREHDDDDENNGHDEDNDRGGVFEQAAAPVYSGVEEIQKHKNKVRSAWISFVGRIVAQMVGAMATVALGVAVLHRYATEPASQPAPAVTVIFVSQETPDHTAIADGEAPSERELAQRQAELARAIAKAVSTAMPTH